jgi:cytochrome P450
MMGLSNIIAGSDTTAVSLSSILYNLMKYPRTLRKLREEIKHCEEKGRCGNPNVSFKESQDMPYLQAVMKEALRIHAATGLPLWRVVPEGGVEICGYFFPEGTTIGINTWCAHYNEDVFGPDAKEFRPERWIEAEKEGGETFKNMEAYYMPVSIGFFLATAISVTERLAVWSRIEDMYRPAYFVLGDVETDPSNCAKIRFPTRASGSSLEYGE